MHLLDLPLNDMHRILLILKYISLLYNSIQSIYTKYVRLEVGESMRHSPFLENTLLQASPELTEAVAWAKTRIRVVEKLLCVKSKQKWKALNQSWNLYIYIYIYIRRVFKSSGSLSLSWLSSNHCVDVCFPFVLEASRS